MAQTSVFRASAFLNTLGVDTHLSYTDGGYANVNNVIADLKYLGITQVRDSLVNPAHLATYEKVAAAGIKFTLTMAGQTQTTATLNAALGLAADLQKSTAGSVEAIEGANEINNWPITYNGVGGLDGAVALQRDIYADVHGSAIFKGVAVDYFTGYGAGNVGVGPDPATPPGLADYDTQHPYPIGGQAPGAQINPAKSLPNESGANYGPVVFTETGYSSNGGTSGAVNQDVQAKYTLDLLFDAMKDGVAKTYLYDLLDAYAPGSAQGDDGYGLFNTNNSPKLVATAVHDLTTILADPGANVSTFAVGALNPTFSGLPSNASDLVLEKSNGVFDVVVWAEPEIWNETSGSELIAPSHGVTVDFNETFKNVQVYDPLIGVSSIAALNNANSATITLTDHPIIIQLSGPSASLSSTQSTTYSQGH